MLKKISLLIVLALIPFTANANTISYDKMPAGEYTLDKGHASIIWKVNHLGLSNYTARFTKFDATIKFDPKDITKSSVSANIDPTSIKTDYPFKAKKDFDKKLVTGKEWFNSEKFPTIKFISEKVEKTSETTGKIHGQMTFLGVSKPIVLDVKFNGGLAIQPFANKPALGFSATGKLKRTDWGFKKYVPSVGDEVSFTIEAEFLKK